MRIENGFFYYNDQNALEQWVKPYMPVSDVNLIDSENVVSFELLNSDVLLKTNKGNEFIFKNYKDPNSCYIEHTTIHQ